MKLLIRKVKTVFEKIKEKFSWEKFFAPIIVGVILLYFGSKITDKKKEVIIDNKPTDSVQYYEKHIKKDSTIQEVAVPKKNKQIETSKLDKPVTSPVKNVEKIDTITINSIPSNAEIYLNDTFWGLTDKTLYITSKKYNISIKKEGYLTGKDIYVPNQLQTTYLFELNK